AGRGGRRGVAPEHGAVPGAAPGPPAAQDEPRPTGPRLAARTHRPASAHAQMRAEDDAAVEAQDEVLADRLDSLEPAAVEDGRVDRGLRARMRGLDLELLTHEHLKPACGAMERVAFGQRLRRRLSAPTIRTWRLRRHVRLRR